MRPTPRLTREFYRREAEFVPVVLENNNLAYAAVLRSAYEGRHVNRRVSSVDGSISRSTMSEPESAPRKLFTTDKIWLFSRREGRHGLPFTVAAETAHRLGDAALRVRTGSSIRAVAFGENEYGAHLLLAVPDRGRTLAPIADYQDIIDVTNKWLRNDRIPLQLPLQ